MQKLDGCITTTAVSLEDISKQIKRNRQLGIQNIIECSDFRENKPIAIVGGGPSLKKYLDELKAFRGPIIACGSVHDFLVANDVAFDHCVLCDPDPLIIKYLKQIQINTKYHIASQCHPDVFENFNWYDKNFSKVERYIWHVGGDELDSAVFEGETIFGGGCTVGSRAIVIAMSFGYSNIHLFGFDSSLDKDFKHHSYDFQTKEESIGNISEIRLGSPEDSETFYCAGYMVGQIFDIKKLLEMYAGRIKITTHCDGALSHLFKLGLEMYNTQEAK